MFSQTTCEYIAPMSFGHGIPNPGEGMHEYYEGMHSQWAGVDTTPYGALNHPCSSAPFQPGGAILTPMSLPDNPYTQPRPSPVMSHHSQEYQYNVSEANPHHGLGITASFPSEFSRSVNAAAAYGYSDATAFSPPQPPSKRSRRSPKLAPSTGSGASREGPVSILPHPEGLQRLEQERRQGHVDPHPHQRPRAPGRGRRDPQAEEEDAFVERLREQNMAWKSIREMFRETFHKDATEARLQMRLLRRRKERLARWDENDVNSTSHAG